MTPLLVLHDEPSTAAPVFDGDMASFIVRAIIGMSGQ